MTPYTTLLYFGALVYVTVPTLLMRFIGRFWQTMILVATLAMLILQYWQVQNLWTGVAVHTVTIVLGYAIVEWAIAQGFLLVRRHGKQRLVFYAAVGLCMAPLLAVKAEPLFASAGIFGFLGISYLTFRALDVIFCIQDSLIPTLPIAPYFAFLLFFPTISSGPIDRYRRFSTDWNRTRTRSEFFDDLDGAAHRIFTGLLYSFVVAALIKKYWLDTIPAGFHLKDLASYAYAYSFYLFFNFAGYSNMAVGVSYLLGVHTPENFRRPFIARNIRDFWNRWHLSLSWWFRDHVYTRFVLAATKGSWFKNKYMASYLGFVLSMGLMGVWHGTEVHYVLYGLYHAGLLIGNDLLSRLNKRLHFWGGGRLWQAAGIFITFNLICFGFLMFSGRLF